MEPNISVEPFHLFRYLDEQACRYNNRKLTDGERFSLAVAGIVCKRLTFDQLTGKAVTAKNVQCQTTWPTVDETGAAQTYTFGPFDTSEKRFEKKNLGNAHHTWEIS